MFRLSRLILFVLSYIMISLALDCNENEVQVQYLNKQIISNGCSKPAFITVEGEEDFTYCCDRHDACYGVCGMNKRYCDNDFKKCMINLCQTTFESNNKCQTAAEMYAMGTEMFGKLGYQQSQDEFCTCVNRNHVYNHYIQLIDNFYDKHVDKNKIKSASSVLSSHKYAKNTGNDSYHIYKDINRIYYDLHKKYDNALGHEGSRIGKISPIPNSKKKEKEL